MFEKREFVKQYVREEGGEKKYIVLDKLEESIFVDRIFNDKDASAILSLVKMAYEQGAIDMADNIKKSLKV